MTPFNNHIGSDRGKTPYGGMQAMLPTKTAAEYKSEAMASVVASQGAAVGSPAHAAAIESLKGQKKALEYAVRHRFPSGSMNYHPVFKSLEDVLSRLAVMSLESETGVALGEARRAAAPVAKPGPAARLTLPLAPATHPRQPKADTNALSLAGNKPSLGAQGTPAGQPSEAPTSGWDDIVGIDAERDAFRDALEEPLLFPQLFTNKGFSAWRGVLLWGPSGTGKTELTKIAENNLDATFFRVDASRILGKFVGESEGNVKRVFEEAKAEDRAIIVMDKCESLMGERGTDSHDSTLRTKAEFLAEMDGFGKANNVMVVGVTSFPEKLDGAFLRRFEKKVELGMPGDAARKLIFEKQLDMSQACRVPSLWAKHDWQDYVTRTNGLTGGAIKRIVENAAQIARKPFLDASWFVRHADGSVWPSTQGTPGAFNDQDTSKLDIRFCIDPLSVNTALNEFEAARLGKIEFGA